jgi:hypothetical protein
MEAHGPPAPKHVSIGGPINIPAIPTANTQATEANVRVRFKGDLQCDRY